MSFKQSALLVHLIKQLRAQGSWCGETHVQKAAYLAKEGRGVPFEHEFVLYRHGPFSFDLRDSLTEMHSRGFTKLDAAPPYGPRIIAESRSDMLEERFAEFLEANDKALKEVTEFVGANGVASLEKLATALFFHLRDASASNETIASRVHEEKPHVSIDSALTAVADVRGWLLAPQLVT